MVNLAFSSRINYTRGEMIDQRMKSFVPKCLQISFLNLVENIKKSEILKNQKIFLKTRSGYIREFLASMRVRIKSLFTT